MPRTQFELEPEVTQVSINTALSMIVLPTLVEEVEPPVMSPVSHCAERVVVTLVGANATSRCLTSIAPEEDSKDIGDIRFLRLLLGGRRDRGWLEVLGILDFEP